MSYIVHNFTPCLSPALVLSHVLDSSCQGCNLLDGWQMGYRVDIGVQQVPCRNGTRKKETFKIFQGFLALFKHDILLHVQNQSVFIGLMSRDINMVQYAATSPMFEVWPESPIKQSTQIVALHFGPPISIVGLFTQGHLFDRFLHGLWVFGKPRSPWYVAQVPQSSCKTGIAREKMVEGGY